MKNDIFTQERLQQFFETDFDELLKADHEEIEYIEQSHGGDMLVETHEEGNERFRLWASYDGEEIIGVEVEYSGTLNGHRWETIFNI